MKTLTIDYRQHRSSRLPINFLDSPPDDSQAISAEAVARGRALADDPTYPSFDLCKQIAQTWIDSQIPALVLASKATRSRA